MRLSGVDAVSASPDMRDVTDEIFQDVMAGLEQVRAHLNGEPVPGLVMHEPGERSGPAVTSSSRGED